MAAIVSDSALSTAGVPRAIDDPVERAEVFDSQHFDVLGPSAIEICMTWSNDFKSMPHSVFFSLHCRAFRYRQPKRPFKILLRFVENI